MASVMSGQETSEYDARVQSIEASGTGEDRPQFVDVGHVLHRFGCQICGRTLLDPVQTACGQRVCRKCIYDMFGENQQSIPCPLKHDDEDAMDTDDLECKNGLKKQDIHNDPATKRQMSKERVYCTHKKLGCMEQMEWKKLQEHVASCQFIPVACPNAAKGCQQQLAAMNMEPHKSACGYADVTCQHCAAHYLRKDEVAHLEECPSAPATCDKCKQTFPNRFKLKVHKSIKCFDGQIPCYYCGGEATYSVKDMEKHLESNKQRHLEAITIRIAELERESSRARTEAGAGAAEGSTARIEEKYKKKHRQLEMFLASINSTVDEFKTRLESQGASGGSGGLGDPGLANNIEQMKRRVDVLERRLPSVNESESLSQQGRDISQLNVRLAELDVRLRRAATTITPGAGFSAVLTWKISEYARKKQDAIAGRNVSLYSPPFYSGEAGYKMCGRIYLNGDGLGKGKCLSLFFVVMKGDFDDLLEWPFVWKVTFSILCPGNPMLDYSETFMPDKDSSSFRKPITDMNIASGCPEFKSQSEVESKYLKNDTLYVRIKVHDPLSRD